MTTQTPISARIDNTLLWSIEQETMAGGTKRNRILNEGARMWLDLHDRRRRMRAYGDDESRMALLVGFLKLYVPEAADLVSVESIYK